MKIISRAIAKKKTETVKGFDIFHFYWSFSSDIMAVKGLTGTSVGHWHVYVGMCRVSCLTVVTDQLPPRQFRFSCGAAAVEISLNVSPTVSPRAN